MALDIRGLFDEDLIRPPGGGLIKPPTPTPPDTGGSGGGGFIFLPGGIGTKDFTALGDLLRDQYGDNWQDFLPPGFQQNYLFPSSEVIQGAPHLTSSKGKIGDPVLTNLIRDLAQGGNQGKDILEGLDIPTPKAILPGLELPVEDQPPIIRGDEILPVGKRGRTPTPQNDIFAFLRDLLSQQQGAGSQRFEDLIALLTERLNAPTSPQLAGILEQIQGALSSGLPPELIQSLTGRIGRGFDRSRQQIIEQFAGQRGGGLSAALAQLAGEEGLALGEAEAQLAQLGLQREQGLLGLLGSTAGQIAGLEQGRELGLLGNIAGLTTAQTQAEQNLLSESLGLGKFQLQFEEQARQFSERMGFNYDQLSQQNQQFLAGLQLDYTQLEQNQRQFAAQMGLNYDQLNQQNRQFLADFYLRQLQLQLNRDIFEEESGYDFGDFFGDLFGAGATILSGNWDAIFNSGDNP